MRRRRAVSGSTSSQMRYSRHLLNSRRNAKTESAIRIASRVVAACAMSGMSG